MVLTDYRTLRANEAGLRASSGHGGSLHYNFQRSISLLFANAGISFNRSMASSITATVMSNDIARTVLIPFENNVSSFGAHAGVSKYIFALGATGSLKGSWSSSGFNQLINDESLPYITRSWTLTPALEARFWKVLSAGYEATGTWTGSRLAGSGGVPGTGENADPDSDFLQLDRRIRRLDQRLSLRYSPLRLLNLRLESRHQHIHQPGMEDLDYIFIDLRSRYSLRKWRMDIDLDITNLANVKRYETFGITANQFTYGRFQLRSRMAVMKVKFNI